MLSAGGVSRRLWGTSRLRSTIPVSPWHQRRRRLADLAAPSARTIRLRPWDFHAPVTRIVVAPLGTPAACRVRLATTTLKPWENVAEYRIRLSLPYILRNTPLLGTTGEKARRIPKRFLRETPDVRGQVTWGSLIDTTCSVLFARRWRNQAAICVLAGYVLFLS